MASVVKPLDHQKFPMFWDPFKKKYCMTKVVDIPLLKDLSSMEFTHEEVEHILLAKDMIKKEFYPLIDEINNSYSEFKSCLTGYFLGGGAIVSLINNESVNDWDLFPTLNVMPDFLWKKILENYPSLVKKFDINYASTEDVPMNTPNAVTLFNNLQIIKRPVNPSNLLDEFDFVHCATWYDLNNDKLHISPRVYHAAKNKILIPTTHFKSGDDLQKKRTDKFLSRGFIKSGDWN